MLELGGKSPNIVFDDADLDEAEAGVLAGIFAAAGQTCVAGSRAYIHEPIYDEFVERLVERARQITHRRSDERRRRRWGRSRRRCSSRKTSRWSARASSEGAEMLAGGGGRSSPGFPDGLFLSSRRSSARRRQDNLLMRNEVFGPVLAVTPFERRAEALALANDTEFGLAAGVWTRDVRARTRWRGELQAGTVWINTYRAMTFNSPFGGYKASGIGRQNGIEAVDQYLQTKSVWCELADEVQDPFVMKA